MERFYTSGNWHVRSGSEDEFTKRWEEFIEYAREQSHGGQFVLLRENDDPKHFVSVGTWSSKEDIQKWMAMPEFQEAYQACGALCDEFHGAPYTVVTSVGL
jgi:heme-degrading monooxygenase HmoA